jgi:hypothetical protein
MFQENIMAHRLTHGCWATTALAAVLLFSAGLRADSVQLVNGDVLNGRVVALDEQQLRLESDVHGKLSIPRAKVVAITLGDRKLAPVAAAPAPAAVPAGPASSLDDLFKQLRAGAAGANEVGEVQKLVPLLSSPDAMGFFQEKLRGLRDGSLNVQDIRKEAIRARDQVKAATKGLGPEADQALAPYLGILERFINESDPARMPAAKQPATAPAKK